MADGEDFYDDDDPDSYYVDDDDDDGVRGGAAVLCRLSTTLSVRFRFCATLSEALRLAEEQPCEIQNCIGFHEIATLDERGKLHVTTATTDLDPRDLTRLLRKLDRERRERENAHHRALYQRQLQRLGLTPSQQGDNNDAD